MNKICNKIKALNIPKDKKKELELLLLIIEHAIKT